MTYEEFVAINTAIKNEVMKDRGKSISNPFVTKMLTIDKVEGSRVTYTNGSESDIGVLIQAIANGQGCVSNPSKIAKATIWKERVTNNLDACFQQFERMRKQAELQQAAEKDRLEQELGMLRAKYDMEYKERVAQMCLTIRSWAKAYIASRKGNNPCETHRNIKIGYKDGKPRVGVGVCYYMKDVLVLQKTEASLKNLSMDPDCGRGNNYTYGVCLSVNCMGNDEKYSKYTKRDGWNNTNLGREGRLSFNYWINQAGELRSGESKTLNRTQELKELVNFYKGFMADYDNFEREIVKEMQGEMAKEIDKVKGENTEGHVITICYKQSKMWGSRQEALAFYKEASENSDGSEQKRYLKIYRELSSGKQICTDEDE